MRHPRRWRVVNAALLMVATGVVAIGGGVPSHAEETPTECRFRYVAGGDGVAFGEEAEEQQDQESEEKRYSRHLLEQHLIEAPLPACEYNTANEPAVTTEKFVTDAHYEGLTQQAAAWERDAHLITLTLGRENDTIINHVTTCFKNVKDHDFLEANACALQILANQAAWDTLKQDLTEILNTFRIQQVGSPNDEDLIIAVTGYFNPYPEATKVATKIPSFCATLVDTIPTCIVRWVQLPPALVSLDLVVKKLNETIENTVKPFTTASQGRFVFVNPYDKFKSHCMRINVKITTKVYHPTNDVHTHEHSDYQNMGCDDHWIASDKEDGRKTPFLYLTPAVTGVLIFADQTTKDMGIYPNDKGHACISDLIWEAVKQKLGVPEPAETNICTGS